MDKEIWTSKPFGAVRAYIPEKQRLICFESLKGGPIINFDDARALADAIYAELGLGWLPYPENKPEDTGLYSIYFITTSKGVVDTDYYDDFDEEWRRYDDVIAFMRYPSKYQPA